MGAACDTICSREASINQIQPNTQSTKSRTNQLLSQSDSNQSSIPSTPDEIYSNESLSQEFEEAIKDGNETMVIFYLEDNDSYCSNLLNKPFTNNDTPLHIAVKYKQYNIIQKLLEEGASINEQNRITGNTPLHIATNQNDIKSVQLLLKYDANAYINNINEETPLSIAQRYKYKNILNEFGEETKLMEDDESDIDTPISNDTDDKPIFLSLNTKQMSNVTKSVLAYSPDVNMPSNEKLLSAYNTQRLSDISSELFKDITSTIIDNRNHLVELNEWLQHKQMNGFSWLKRWVIIKNGYMLWSDRQITVENSVTKEEKLRWNKCIKLTKIVNVQKVKCKNERKFKMYIKHDRNYIWRCKTKEIRDKWVNGLKQHIAHCKMESTYT
eukprot:33252_1